MNTIVTYPYDKKKIIKSISDWQYGSNWPIVYIFYNNKTAYVGETLDAVRRTEQHMHEKVFDSFTNICLISSKTFNKSVVLDLESFLIKYMSADGKRKLINGNHGVLDHKYFYKEAYEDDFKNIWQVLLDKKLVQKSLFDIENSEFYKYSPYKSLSADQYKVVHQIVDAVSKINHSSSRKSIIKITGGAGTGKTILAVYLVKLLSDIKRKNETWKYIDDPEEAEYVKWVSEKLGSIKDIGFVVPMKELRNTMKKIFKTIEGLSEDMILSPEQVVDRSRFDLLVVDEAHRLYKKYKLTSPKLNQTFNDINIKLMGESAFTGKESDLTELDWIIGNSNLQILFYDEKQAIRSTDIGKTRFEQICKPYLYDSYNLVSQMRCNGGNGYYEYVSDVLFKQDKKANEYKRIENYELQVVDSMNQLNDLLKDKKNIPLCKRVAGPAWSLQETIKIDNKEYHWFSGKEDKTSIYSIHKIQGFDLNYAGVIFGEEVYYDNDKKRIEVKKEMLKDDRAKGTNDEEMRNYVLNIYLTLMTRGIRGTFIYAVDKNLREYLKMFLNQP